MNLDMPIDVEQLNLPVFSQDKRLHATFYSRAVPNRFRTQEEGRPVYEQKDYIRLMVPGDRNYELDVPATDHYQQRFPDQWSRYKRGQGESMDGTPLESWPALNVAQVAELRAMNVATVDQLAVMPDQLAQKMMGNFKLREKAQAFLEASKGTAQASKLEAELKKRDDDIAQMREQIAALTAAASKATPVNAVRTLAAK